MKENWTEALTVKMKGEVLTHEKKWTTCQYMVHCNTAIFEYNGFCE